MENTVKILIVDDSKAMRMIVMRHLRQAGDDQFEFAEASNGLEALAMIRSDAPDLVLCDCNMPEMSGFELLHALRAEGSDVRFGFVTSESSSDVRAQAAEAGAQFLIAKPFTVESFAQALSEVGI